MNTMSAYYISRAIFSVLWGILFFLTGSPWWQSILAGVLVLAAFIWAPKSGRFTVRPEKGVFALQREERTQAITDKAARNTLVVTMLISAGMALYFGGRADGSVPVLWLNAMLLVGVITYWLSDLMLRRNS